MQRFSRALVSAIDLAVQAYARDGKSTGLVTGFQDLDRFIGGLQRSDFVVLAGRPGMGKTALATNIAYNVASAWQGEHNSDDLFLKNRGGVVGFFSFEMSAEQIATRIISAQSNIPADLIFNGNFTPDEFDRIASIARTMEKMPLYIDDTGGVSIHQLAARATQLKRERGLDLLLVDTVQMLQRTTGRSAGSVSKLSTITAGLKSLAKELEVPVVAVSQLSKAKTSRDERPQLNQLDSSLEQDADIVMLLFRPEHELSAREPAAGTEVHFRWETELEAARGRAEIIIYKNRHGPTGSLHLTFDAGVARFSDPLRGMEIQL